MKAMEGYCRYVMSIRVVEFSSEGYEIRKINFESSGFSY
jgi:hypothetical protein